MNISATVDEETDFKDLEYDDLAGKNYLVTGGSSGIGREVARILLQNGAHVILLGRRPQLLHQLAQVLSNKGSISVYPCDLERPAEVKSVFLRALEEVQGNLNGIVNSAGVIHSKDFKDTTLQEWDQIMNVNVRVPMQLISMAIPFMKLTGGAIVNVSAAPMPRPKQTIFSVSKAMLDSMTQCAALEVANFGIRINCVAPGFVDTGLRMHQKDLSLTAVQNHELMKQAASQTPTGKVSSPANIAHTAVWLLSDQSSFVNGEVLAVDGGASISSKTSSIQWHNPEVEPPSILSQGMKALNLGNFFKK